MLSHVVSFGQQHGYVGRYSEAPIEPYHSRFNRQMLITHRNCYNLSAISPHAKKA